jgi:molybdopterin converting factor subunit 1
MKVRLLLFAMYAEALGAHELPLELPAGATAADALADVRRRAGAEHLPPKPLIAVNRRYAKPETALKDGDEVALIPPVAGG